MFNSPSPLWDKKAKYYNRFTPNHNTFQYRILTKLKERGIIFHNKTLLDVGCGTGIYTLHLAKEALHVKALDFSIEMLNILKADAKKEGLLPKLTIEYTTWEDFQSDTPFNILFSSMSPALRSHLDFEKFHALANEYCIYLGWAGKRESTLLDPIFKAHSLSLKAPPGAERLKAWLEEHCIDYCSEYIEESRLHVKPYEEALNSILWHLEINQTVPNMQHIQTFLAPLTHNNTITFETKIGVELISWKK